MLKLEYKFCVNKMNKSSSVLCCLTVAESFDAQSISLRLQKKLLGKVTSRRVVSAFIDETTARLLNNLYRLSRDLHDGDKRAAEKAVRRLIKTVIKTGILYRNEQFSDDELTLAQDFQKRFRIIAMTIVSFHQVGSHCLSNSQSLMVFYVFETCSLSVS